MHVAPSRKLLFTVAGNLGNHVRSESRVDERVPQCVWVIVTVHVFFGVFHASTNQLDVQHAVVIHLNVQHWHVVDGLQQRQHLVDRRCFRLPAARALLPLELLRLPEGPQRHHDSPLEQNVFRYLRRWHWRHAHAICQRSFGPLNRVEDGLFIHSHYCLSIVNVAEHASAIRVRLAGCCQ